MRFAFLGSGSRGNAALIESGDTCIMLDCGFSAKETQSRLTRLGKRGEDISAIVLTHEHSDHVNGVGAVARKFDLPVWMTSGTLRAIESRAGRLPKIELFNLHHAFAIGDIVVEPFPVPHDAHEPSQFVFTAGGRRLGVLTDTGCSTPHIERVLSGCHALILECNHDREMLLNGDYPPSLKQRVAGDRGHLDNETAAEILRNLDHSNLEHLVIAHISEKNNTEYLARLAVSNALGCSPQWPRIVDQDAGLTWCEIEAY